MRHFAQKSACLARRLGGHKLQHGRQVIRQLTRRQIQPGFFVGLREIDHRRATLACVSMHMLEQVQRGVAAAIEQRYIVGFTFQCVIAGQRVDQCIDFGLPRIGQRRLAAQNVTHLGKVRARFRSGITQQSRQHAQTAAGGYRSRQWQHGQTSSLMGMVRFFSLPKRLVSLLPSEQPLPNEKPQLPRTLKVFSAYSRCVLGMTKRSS